jgi:hypothetical protein
MDVELTTLPRKQTDRAKGFGWELMQSVENKDDDKTLERLQDEAQIIRTDMTVAQVAKSRGVPTDEIVRRNRNVLKDSTSWIGTRIRRGQKIAGAPSDGRPRKRARIEVQAEVRATQVTRIRCGVCQYEQDGNGEGGECSRCATLFTQTPGYPTMGVTERQDATGEGHLGTETAVQEMHERMDGQRTEAHIRSRQREQNNLERWATDRARPWRDLTAEEVAAYLSESDTRGWTVFHDDSCKNFRSEAIESTCGEGCRKGTAPSSMETRQTTVQTVYNRIGRTGRWTASARRNNPAQSNVVDLFIKKYREEGAAAGHVGKPRVTILSKAVRSALCEARARWRAAGARQDKGSSKERNAAGFEALKWAQTGAAIAIAHDAGQRGASMTDVRADSAAILEQGESSMLILNANMTKTRRDGQAAWFACKERGAVDGITCPVRWFRDYQKAIKGWAGSRDAFIDRPGARVFGKIWSDRSTGKTVLSFDPQERTTTAMLSDRLVELLKAREVMVKHAGFASLRSGGALAAILTHDRSVEQIMRTAEWKQVKTFQRYTQLREVLGGEKGERSEETTKPWAMLSEEKYVQANRPFAEREGTRVFMSGKGDGGG